jgi:hypothetical protein
MSEEDYVEVRIESELSDWQCYLFGSTPDVSGIVYRPRVGGVPNLFVRLVMRVCFDCLWVKDKK